MLKYLNIICEMLKMKMEIFQAIKSSNVSKLNEILSDFNIENEEFFDDNINIVSFICNNNY